MYENSEMEELILINHGKVVSLLKRILEFHRFLRQQIADTDNTNILNKIPLNVRCFTKLSFKRLYSLSVQTLSLRTKATNPFAWAK